MSSLLSERNTDKFDMPTAINSFHFITLQRAETMTPYTVLTELHIRH